MPEYRRSVPDYKLKSELLKSGAVNEVKQLQRSLWAKAQRDIYGEIIPVKIPVDDAPALYAELQDAFPDTLRECENILHAQRARSKRLRSRIEEMITSFDCTFVTLTFNDDCLSSTSPETRRQYVFRFLKSQSLGKPYVANIDFGAKKGREHYHAVCAFRVSPSEWSCGSLNVKKVVKTSNPLKLSKYISKLTNHAIKETAKRVAIIYSR